MQLAKLWRYASVLIMGFLILACGGGGDDGPATSISVSPGSLEFTADQNGAAPIAQSVNVSFKGDGVVIGYPTGVTPPGWLGVSTSNVTSSTLRAEMNILSTQLNPGSYSTTLRFLSGKKDGSNLVQQDVMIRYTVRHGLAATVSSMTFRTQEGLAPQAQTLTLQADESAFSWKLRIEASNGMPTDWLSLSSASGTGSGGRANVEIVAAPRTRGSYAATLVLLTGTDEVRARIPIGYEVAPAYTIPTSISRQLDQGASLADLDLPFDLTPSLSGSDGSGLTWQIASDQPWISVSPASGNLGAPVHFNARLSPELLWSMGSGSYHANLNLVVTGGTVASATIPVSLQLNLAPALNLASPTPFSLTNATTSAELVRTVEVISNLGEAFRRNMTWTATSSETWLRITKAAGGTDSDSQLSFQVDVDALGSPYVGNRSAQLALTPSDPHFAAVQRNIQLNLALSTVNTVSPYMAFTGQGGEVILRGTGFSGQQSLRVHVGDTVLPGTVVDDTELHVSLPAISSPQRLPVRVENGVGLDLGKAELVVQNVPAYAAQTFTSTTGFDRITLDAEHQAVLLYGKWNPSVQRYRFADGAWISDSFPQVEPTAVALSQDGREFLVTAGYWLAPRTISRLDATTLAVKETVTLDTSMGNFSMVAAFNDGVTWLIDEDVPRILPFPLAQGLQRPWFEQCQMVMSLDRSQFVMGAGDHQEAFYSCDANLKLISPCRISGGGGLFFERIAGFSRDASRFVFRTSVYDKAFRLLGYLDGPGNPSALAVSPDGRSVIVASGSPTVFRRHDISGTGPFPGDVNPLPFTVAPDQGVTRMLFSEDGGTLFVLATNLAGTTFYVFPLS